MWVLGVVVALFVAIQLVPYGWNRSNPPVTGDAIEQIEDGAMPPSQYTLVHPGAALTGDEQAELIAALRSMDERD